MKKYKILNNIFKPNLLYSIIINLIIWKKIIFTNINYL